MTMRQRLLLLVLATASSWLTMTLWPTIDPADGEVTVPPFKPDCPRLYGVHAHRQLSLKVWRRPGGPTARMQQRLGHQRHCALPGRRGAMVAASRRVRRGLVPVRRRKAAWTACSQSSVLPCIRHAALVYHQDYGFMVSLASCETGGTFDPHAVNPTPVGSEHAGGLFQFLPSTWATTPYAGKDQFVARWSALGAAWMLAQGRRGEWAC